jgi:DNA-binding CsgD family transcriptional regulator
MAKSGLSMLQEQEVKRTAARRFGEWAAQERRCVRMQVRDDQVRGLQDLSNYFPREALLSALNDSKVGVVICDRQMRYKMLNESVADIHNVPIEGHMGRRFHEILGSFSGEVIPHWDWVFSTGQPLPNLEITGRLPKRSEAGHWIENLFPLRDKRGRVTQVGCFVIELSPSRLHSPHPRTFAEEVAYTSGPRLAGLDGRGTAQLSPREREVVRLVAMGKSNKEISSVLAISVRTVETHRARLMLKLNATSVAHVVHYAIRNQIVVI